MDEGRSSGSTTTASAQMGATPDERARVEACIDDDGALAELYREHGAAVRRFLYRLLPTCSLEDADDLCHEVFLQVPRAARRYRGDAPVQTWLFGIAARVARSKARRHAIRRALFLERSPAPPEASRDTPDLRVDLERALARLSPTHREVLVLTVIEGQSAKEAARVLGIEEKTVWTRLHRARQTLRRALEPEPREARS